MKVFQLISGMFYGGGHRVALDLCDGLRRVGDLDTHLCILGDRDETMAAAADHLVPYNGRYNDPRVLWSSSRALRQLLLRERPKVLHSHGWDADIIAGLALRGTGIRHVVTWHVTPDWLRSGAVQHYIRRFLTRRYMDPSQVIMVTVADAVTEFICEPLGWKKEEVRSIHNGIRHEIFSQGTEEVPRGSDGELVIGTAARLAPNKGLMELLDAFLVVSEKYKVRWRIAGKGPMGEVLGERLSRKPGHEAVQFLGHVDDMPGFYRSIDVFVLPSLHGEGFPLAILEGMASGVPVIATDVAGAREAFRDGSEGLLIPPGDVKALASAMEKLARDAALRSSMGAEARKRVERDFSINTMCRKYADVYKEILGVVAAPGPSEERAGVT